MGIFSGWTYTRKSMWIQKEQDRHGLHSKTTAREMSRTKIVDHFMTYVDTAKAFDTVSYDPLKKIVANITKTRPSNTQQFFTVVKKMIFR